MHLACLLDTKIGHSSISCWLMINQKQTPYSDFAVLLSLFHNIVCFDKQNQFAKTCYIEQREYVLIAKITVQMSSYSCYEVTKVTLIRFVGLYKIRNLLLPLIHITCR
jgi:hypothetical protein